MSLAFADTEATRVAEHIEGAIAVARGRARSGIDGLRGIVRGLLLEELEAYRQAGVFPKNRDFADRPMPYFVDADGTRCAMAHLLEAGGASALVARIARDRNNAFVRELADEPELLEWLAAAGLTVEEAARIQPSYCGPNTAIVCGGSFSWRDPISTPAIGVVEVVIPAADAGGSGARVEAVYGDTGTVKVGDEVIVTQYVSAGARILFPLFADTVAADAGALPSFAQGLTIQPDGVTRGQAGSNEGHPLTTAQIAEAFLAPNCAANLTQRDPWWGKSSCDGEVSDPVGRDAGESVVTGPNGNGSSTGGGCSTTGAADGSAATIQILLAVVGVIAARRVSRASRGSR